MKVRNALSMKRASAVTEDAMGKLRAEVATASNTRQFNTKKEVSAFRKNWMGDYHPMVYDYIPPTTAVLNSLPSNVRKRKIRDSEEQTKEEALGRWSAAWVEACISDRTDERMFNVATKDISLLV